MDRPQLRFDGTQEAAWTLILAHGAGQPMDSAFMTVFAQGLSGHPRASEIGGMRVARFEFPYMADARRRGTRKAPDREPILRRAWQEAVAVAARGCERGRLLIGGKSLGGRIATLIADEAGVAGVIGLGYPFHPPGRPERPRTAHLKDIATPTLICQGTRDPFGTPTEVRGYELSSRVHVHWVEDGDHSFTPRETSGRTEERNRASAMNAVLAFVAGLERGRRAGPAATSAARNAGDVEAE